MWREKFKSNYNYFLSKLLHTKWDGYNDNWSIKGLTPEFEAKIYIFDRYGKLLKQIDAYGNGWDGKFNGTEVPSSDYWFKIEYKEDGVQKEFKSHFSLKR